MYNSTYIDVVYGDIMNIGTSLKVLLAAGVLSCGAFASDDERSNPVFTENSTSKQISCQQSELNFPFIRIEDGEYKPIFLNSDVRSCEEGERLLSYLETEIDRAINKGIAIDLDELSRSYKRLALFAISSELCEGIHHKFITTAFFKLASLMAQDKKEGKNGGK